MALAFELARDFWSHYVQRGDEKEHQVNEIAQKFDSLEFWSWLT